jgi:hypothetical protein
MMGRLCRVNDYPYINDVGSFLKKIQGGDPLAPVSMIRESPAPRIANWEQIFDNQYLREFEAKIEKVSVSV